MSRWDLFTDAARIDKQEKLDRAADALRRRFGGAAVTRATLLTPDTRKPRGTERRQGTRKRKKSDGRGGPNSRQHASAHRSLRTKCGYTY